MRPYFDSGFLFKLYWRESNSAAAWRRLQDFAPPLLISRFNEIEIVQSARRKTWLRGADGLPQMTGEQFEAGMALFEQGLRRGRIIRQPLDYEAVFDWAGELSRRFGHLHPIKTADLLHVALLEFGFDHLVTADKQQYEFALRAGYSADLLPP